MRAYGLADRGRPISPELTWWDYQAQGNLPMKGCSDPNQDAAAERPPFNYFSSAEVLSQHSKSLTDCCKRHPSGLAALITQEANSAIVACLGRRDAKRPWWRTTYRSSGQV